MALFENQTFTDEVIHLDGNEYNSCRFQGCQIVFSAVAPVRMNSATFHGCSWDLQGAARLTLEFISGVYRIKGMQEFVENTFENIRGGGEET
jgi:hypothetical protein